MSFFQSHVYFMQLLISWEFLKVSETRSRTVYTYLLLCFLFKYSLTINEEIFSQPLHYCSEPKRVLVWHKRMSFQGTLTSALVHASAIKLLLSPFCYLFKH